MNGSEEGNEKLVIHVIALTETLNIPAAVDLSTTTFVGRIKFCNFWIIH